MSEKRLKRWIEGVEKWEEMPVMHRGRLMSWARNREDIKIEIVWKDIATTCLFIRSWMSCNKKIDLENGLLL